MRLLIIDNVSIIKRDGVLLTGQHNGHFIEQLFSHGHQITWFQNVQENVKSLACFDLKANGVSCVIASKVKGNKFLRYLKSYLRFIPQVFRTDFCYIYFPSSFKYCALICRLLHKPYGVYVRGMNDLDGKVSGYILRHAAIILTVTDYFTERMRVVNPSGKVHTIKPMLELSVRDIDRSKREYLQSDTVNLLYLGRIDPAKGIRELIEAVRLLNQKYSDKKVRLRIVGSGQFFNEAKLLAKDLTNVSFEGAVYDKQDKKRYYREADLYVLPTYHEGFPRTIYESLAYGTPVLTTMVGGIPGLMKDGENCVEIERGSAEDIVKKIEFIMSSPDICQRLSSNGFKTVESVFDESRPTHAHLLDSLL